ncbi:MFS transporter [Amaricoccus sp.]|uniref:MFS transporter n=1 Tax=Amaricoccus sp. TaxID=1872485 RepID=UPI001B7B9D88|nr:MFS transporter [Amaricoccus sp.]MBP7241600.1 MFS transporter [Amaricoccus sp.]
MGATCRGDAVPTGADRRGVFAWMLFDWANQPFQTLIVTFVFAPWFVAEVVGDPARGQALWGAAAAIAGVCVAVLAPVLGAVADRTGARKPWVLAFSVPYLLGCVGLWLATPAMPDPTVVLVCYALAFIGSEFGQVFINAMLPSLAPRAEIGRISGSGWALGYLGGVVSLLIVLALLAPAPGSTLTLLGAPPILGLDPGQGEPARATGPFAAIWYVVFALPMFLWTPDAPGRPLRGAVRAGLADLRATIATARARRDLLLFLLASMVYRDALVGLFTFGGIYAAGVLGWGMFELGLFGIVAAGVGAAGAWIGGRADHAYGPRAVIVASIWALIGLCVLVVLTTRESVLLLPVPPGSRIPDLVFFAAGGLLGATSGALQAASRTLLVHQAEGVMQPGQAFGLFALSGKATAFLAPALIAAVTAATGSQRLGLSPVILLFLVGLVLLYGVKTTTEQHRGQAA